MTIGFAEALTVLGLLLIGVAAASGLVNRTVLSITVLSVLAGAILELTGVLSVNPEAHALVVVVELVLLVTLFSDGLLVEQSFLRHHWGAPARALVIAMPVNASLLAAAAKLLFPELGWDEAFLVGFVLAPTDPVITSSIVSSEHVPAHVRNVLNLESGLNDGLALPFVLFFLTLVTSDGGVADAAADLGLETVVGLGVGVAAGLGAGLLLDRLPQWAITERYEGLYALGVGASAFGIAQLLHGNGLIAAFCAGVAVAVTRHEVPSVFHDFNEGLSSILQIVAFVLFGAVVVGTGVATGALPLIGFVLFALVIARPASILLSFVGTGLDRAERGFVAWFGPKGVASMLFALFVLESSAPDRTLVFDIASLTILASIVAHGFTDTVGAGWISRRLDKQAHGAGQGGRG